MCHNFTFSSVRVDLRLIFSAMYCANVRSEIKYLELHLVPILALPAKF